MTSVSEPSPAADVLEPSPVAEVSGPSLAAGVAETSSAAVTVTVEEVMELVTGRYIDFPGVGIVDLNAPELSGRLGDAGGGDGADVHRSINLGDDRIGLAGAALVQAC
jgi:hypothetical protein